MPAKSRPTAHLEAKADSVAARAEFDQFAGDYAELHAENIRASGEEPAYFAEYKIREIAACVTAHPIANIMDFGAGVGASVPYFRHYFPRATVECIDVSSRSLRIARSEHGDNANYRKYDGTAIPLPDGSVDLAFAACVFHHIRPDNHAHALQEILRVIRPGGHLFLFEHNPLNPLTLRAVSTCAFDADAILIRAGVMNARVRSAGLTPHRMRFCVFFPSFLSALRPLERALAWLPLGAQYYIWARKP